MRKVIGILGLVLSFVIMWVGIAISVPSAQKTTDFPLPSNAPLDYYSEEEMNEYVPHSFNNDHKWVLLYNIIRLNPEKKSEFTDIVSFVLDTRTGLKYGKSKIIAVRHVGRTTGQDGSGENKFCVFDNSYLIGSEKVKWEEFNGSAKECTEFINGKLKAILWWEDGEGV